MKGKRKASAIFAILSLIISVFMVVLPPIYASPGGVDVSFPSYSWMYPEHKPGDTVVMELKIDNSSLTGEPVKSFQANFSWDPTILNCTGVYEGLFLKGPYLNWSTSFTAGAIDNVAGTVTGVNGTLTQAGKNATAGSGVLAYVWFKVLRVGSSTIDLTDCDVLDPSWSAITPVTLVDGYFELGVKITLASYSWGYPDKNLGESVVMELKIEAPEAADWTYGVITWEADFSFDPKILECTTVYEGLFLKGPYLNWSTSFTAGAIDNVAGTVTGVNGTLTQAGKNATGSEILAYLAFKVIGAGSTAVTITSFTVLDTDSLSIPLTLTHGSFEMGLKVSLPTVNWWYPDHNIGDFVVMELYIEAPEAADWTGGVVSWEADFSFDPTILQALPALGGTYLAGPYFNWTNTFTAGAIDNVAGTVTGVNGTLTQAGKNATGSGILAFLRFQVVGVGSTDVTITDCTVLVSDPYAVPLTLIDGHFGLGTTLSLPTYAWTYGGHKPGDALVMELRIDTPELFAWQAGFTFDPNVLELLNVVEGPYLKGPYGNWSTIFTAGTINHTTGVVTPYGCTLTGNYSASGSGILAYLVFNVTGVGSTDVVLTDVILQDPDLHDVPPTLVDGQFDFGVEVEVGSDIILRYPDYDIGYTFWTNLTIIAPESIFAWQAGFTFDPNVLNVLSITEGPYLSSAGPTSFVAGNINNTSGIVTPYSCTLLGSVSASATPPEGAVMAYIQFNVTGAGSTTIDLTDVNLDPTEVILYTLADGNLIEVPPILVDGYFELGAIVELVPSVEYTYPTDDIGDVFDVNLTVKTPSLFALQAGFSFDPNVVEILSITEGPYLNDSGTTQWISGTINNTSGVVTPYGCTLLGSVSAGPTGAGGATLATLTFNVTGAGNTTIEITDLELYSSEIPATVIDGYFELAAGMHIETFAPWVSFPGTVPYAWLIIETPGLYAWQAGFTFDPSELEIVFIDEGPYLKSGGTTHWIPGTINNTSGVVTPYGCTILGAGIAPPSNPFDDDGDGSADEDPVDGWDNDGDGKWDEDPVGAVIAIIYLHAKVLGTINITITDAQAYSSTTPVKTVTGEIVTRTRGDVDNSGVVDALDIKRVKMVRFGYIPIQPTAWADVNWDGIINALDIKQVKMIRFGYIT